MPTPSLPPVVVQSPPERALGDLAVPLAFELARRLRKAPRAIAQEIAAALGPIPGVARVVAAPNGYLNFYCDRPAFLRARLAAAVAPLAAPAEKAVVEHTAINPNKAAHIGHLRNAALGDTLGRLLRFRGQPVEIQNYIDDTGVQVADVVVGFRELERKDFEAVRQIADSTRFDYHCWDLYAAVTEWYEGDKERLKIRAATLHDIEHGGNENARIGAFIADRIVRCHLATMGRLGIDYDLLTWEGDILRLKFWDHAFDALKAKGAVFRQEQGRLAGCWVMTIEDEGAESGTPEVAETDAEDAAESREKVIVRSDGTVTYVGKDIANQFWKFGLLGWDFHYRVFDRREGGHPVWATTSDASAAEAGGGAPAFGRADVVYNVIDTRQSYLQKLLKQALGAMGYPREAEQSIHYAYEMVALSHATARALGYDAEVDAGRPFVEVSGRKGLGVKADDLLDRLIDAAHGEVVKRNPDLPAEETLRVAETIATAAVRYFLIKFSRGKVIAFDIEEALSFEGETGPYPAVRRGAREQHLSQAAGTGRRRGGGVRVGARRDVHRRARVRRGRRVVGPGARGVTPRRDGRPGAQDARALGRGEVRVRSGAEVQRLLSQVPHPQRRAPGRPAVARGGGRLLPRPADARARPDGLPGAVAHVAQGKRPWHHALASPPVLISRTISKPCSAAAASPTCSSRPTRRPPRSSTGSTACC